METDRQATPALCERHAWRRGHGGGNIARAGGSEGYRTASPFRRVNGPSCCVKAALHELCANDGVLTLVEHEKKPGPTIPTCSGSVGRVYSEL